MTFEQIQDWASAHHYPSLVLAPGIVLGASRQNWSLFFMYATEDRMALLVKRIGAWDTLAKCSCGRDFSACEYPDC